MEIDRPSSGRGCSKTYALGQGICPRAGAVSWSATMERVGAARGGKKRAFTIYHEECHDSNVSPRAALRSRGTWTFLVLRLDDVADLIRRARSR